MLRTKLTGELKPDVVLVSPMLRTLQTAMASLDWLDERIPFQGHAGWQETTANPCDVGVAVSEIAPTFPRVDFATVDPLFPEKKTPETRLYAYQRRALVTRGQTVLGELYKRTEPVVVVVSHSAFLSKAVSGSTYANADFRIFNFEEPLSDAKAAAAGDDGSDESLPPLVYRLKEWEETRLGHGGMGWSEDQVREIGDELPL